MEARNFQLERASIRGRILFQNVGIVSIRPCYDVRYTSLSFFDKNSHQKVTTTVGIMTVRKEEIILYSCYWLAAIVSICQAVNTDTAGIYDPVFPHGRIPTRLSPCYSYPYHYDYDYPRAGQQVRRRGINSSPSQPQSQPPSSSVPAAADSGQRRRQSIPSRPSVPQATRPYFYRYPYQNQRPSPNEASGFHAANQVEFLGPVQSAGNGNQPPKFYKRPIRPHPRPTCTIQGLGGGGGSSSGAAMA